MAFNTQNDRWQASRLAWRAGGDDKAFLDAHQPVYLTFKLGDLPLALGQRTRRIRDPIDLGHQPFNQHIRLKKRPVVRGAPLAI
jgi:hypothetical protein